MKDTPIDLRNQVMYQIFVRQHSTLMNFKGVMDDLKRIKALGVDIIYLLPFHPIGKKSRKGTIGSPYSIMNYYDIDKVNGTIDDFDLLVKEAHKLDMKVMMDIVFNHTSRDSDLALNRSHLFYKNAQGELANRIGDWSDIADLDFSHDEVRETLIDVLAYWAKKVDGFRCDVAPLIPLEFWREARLKTDLINPNLIWLTESVEYGFIKYLRDLGFDASSDSMMYDVFDICYDYDIYPYMNRFLEGQIPLSKWLEEIYRQEVIYPKNYVKLRSFENHDQARIATKVKSKNQLNHLTAMQFFIKGMPMIYAGQEYCATKRPNLFEIDIIDFNLSQSIEPLIKQLSLLKKDAIMRDGAFKLIDYKVPVMLYETSFKTRIGIFNLEEKESLYVPLIDGFYQNLINSEMIEVFQNQIKHLESPIIIDVDNAALIKDYQTVGF